MAPSIRDGCDEEVRGHADARDDLEGPNDGRLPGESPARDGQRERFKTEGARHECGASPRSPSLPALSEEAEILVPSSKAEANHYRDQKHHGRGEARTDCRNSRRP